MTQVAAMKSVVDKVLNLPDTVNMLVSQVKRLENRLDILPGPFDATPIWVRSTPCLVRCACGWQG